MKSGRKTRLAAMMVAAAVITMAGMASAGPRQYSVDDPSTIRVPVGRARYETLVGRRAGTDAAKRAAVNAFRAIRFYDFNGLRLPATRIRLHE